jgi:prepilin-type N-terminal cleavage/methylation domain-containing protein
LPAYELQKAESAMTQRRKNSGFTLIELMIVIGILGLLATVAITSYNAYVRRSRKAEAAALLADIRLKQEAYRGTFHQYHTGIPAACGNDWVPRSKPGPKPATAGLTGNCEKAWRQLGISFPSTLYFVYDTQGGPPGAAVTGRYAAANAANDFWYGAAAIEDLNDDSKCGGLVVVSGDIKITEVEESISACNYN